MSVARTESTTATDLVRWFDQISMADVAIVGGKNASLGEMYRQLTPARCACSQRVRHNGGCLSHVPARIRTGLVSPNRNSR